MGSNPIACIMEQVKAKWIELWVGRQLYGSGCIFPSARVHSITDEAVELSPISCHSGEGLTRIAREDWDKEPWRLTPIREVGLQPMAECVLPDRPEDPPYDDLP